MSTTEYFHLFLTNYQIFNIFGIYLSCCIFQWIPSLQTPLSIFLHMPRFKFNFLSLYLNSLHWKRFSLGWPPYCLFKLSFLSLPFLYLFLLPVLKDSPLHQHFFKFISPVHTPFLFLSLSYSPSSNFLFITSPFLPSNPWLSSISYFPFFSIPLRCFSLSPATTTFALNTSLFFSPLFFSHHHSFWTSSSYSFKICLLLKHLFTLFLYSPPTIPSTSSLWNLSHRLHSSPFLIPPSLLFFISSSVCSFLSPSILAISLQTFISFLPIY